MASYLSRAIPFHAQFTNSLFGLCVEHLADEPAVQPALYAPLMGSDHSTKSRRIFFICSVWWIWTKRLNYLPFSHARSLRDDGLPRNVVGSLNDTINNMTRFQMDNYYSGWNPELKGYDYKEDVLGTVKNVSSLQAIAFSQIMDNRNISQERQADHGILAFKRKVSLFIYG